MAHQDLDAVPGPTPVFKVRGLTKVSALGVEEQRVWVIVAFASPAAQWSRLGDGYRVEASFILWEQPDVLQIPASALFCEGESWFVYGVAQGKAVKRAVQIGQRPERSGDGRHSSWRAGHQPPG